jgi:protein TonB
MLENKVLTLNRTKSSENLFWKLLFASALIHFVYIGFKEIKIPVANIDSSKVKPIKLKIISSKRKKQIVETNQKENREVLERARDVFLGKNNSAVKKQTIAKNIGKFSNEAGSAIKRGKAERKGQKAKKFSLADLNFKKNLLFVPKKNIKPKHAGKSTGGALLRSSSNDHVKNIPLGDITELNTTEFKFYGFYHRIKQKLEQHWGNTLRQKAKALYKRGQTIRGKGEKLTALLVILDSRGNILKVQLKSTSGVEELDAAAVESFNKAGPFPNPPREMLKLGKAFIEWGFVVKT